MSIKDPYTKEDRTRFTMRINSELMERIKSQAVQSKRSAAKEIEFILEKWFENIPKE